MSALITRAFFIISFSINAMAFKSASVPPAHALYESIVKAFGEISKSSAKIFDTDFTAYVIVSVPTNNASILLGEIPPFTKA